MSENSPKKICPLLSSAGTVEYEPCQGDSCAWFHLEYHQDGDFTQGECALLRIADRLGSVGEVGK